MQDELTHIEAARRPVLVRRGKVYVSESPDLQRGVVHLDLLGHGSLSTTERYTRVEVSDLREVIRRCHPRERERRG